jgi:hypothetical protein
LDVWVICYKDVEPFSKSFYAQFSNNETKGFFYLTEEAAVRAYPNAWAKARGKVKIVRCRLLPKESDELVIE